MPAPRRLSISDIKLLVRETGLRWCSNYYELESGINMTTVAAGGQLTIALLECGEVIILSGVPRTLQGTAVRAPG